MNGHKTQTVDAAASDAINKLAAALKPAVSDTVKSEPSTRRGGSARARVLGITTSEGKFVSTRSLRANGYDVQQSGSNYAVTLRKGFSNVEDNETDAHRSSELTEDDDAFNTSRDGIIEVPFSYPVLTDLLTSNATHGACVETKANDYAYSTWKLTPTQWATDNVSPEVLAAAKAEIETFLETAGSKNQPFADVCRDIAIDYESLGSACVEILRTRAGLLGAINHVPMSTVRRLRKVITDDTGAMYIQKRFSKKVYFTDFGYSITCLGSNGVPINPETCSADKFPEYDARLAALRWDESFVHYRTTDETLEFDQAASEMLLFARPPQTRSSIYGTPAGITALTSMRAQLHIDKFNLQFFASKGVPQYAVVFSNLSSADGAEGPVSVQDGVDHMTPSALDELESTVQLFFERKLAESDRSVLVLELYGDAKVSFEKLNNQKFEASFAEYEDRNYDRVRLSHRTPNVAIGVDGKNTGLGGTKEIAQMRRYRDHIARPGQCMLAAFINKLIRGGLFIPYFTFSFDPIEIEEADAKQDSVRKNWLSGLMRRSEARTRLGLPVADDGSDDVYLTPSGKAVTAITETDQKSLLKQSIQREEVLRAQLAGNVPYSRPAYDIDDEDEEEDDI